MLGLTGLCCGGFGLWSMRHPFGADTDLSSLAQALDLVVPTSLTPTLHSAYDTAQVRGRRWVSFARGGGVAPMSGGVTIAIASRASCARSPGLVR